MPTPAEQEFNRKLRETFNVEAEEHLQAMSTMLLELEKDSAATAINTIENVYREAHSLKGAARAVDLVAIESICQAIESVFSAWKHQKATPSTEAFDVIHQSIDVIRAQLLASSSTQGNDFQKRNELVEKLVRLQAASPVVAPVEKSSEEICTEPQIQVASALAPMQDAEKIAPAETVRISLAVLDARLLQAEDMLTIKATTAQRAKDLRSVARLFESWQKEWAKISPQARAIRQNSERESKQAGEQSLSPAATLVDFLDWNCDYIRSMESKLAALATQVEQDRHNVAKRVDDLLEDSKKLLMLPFSTVSGIFPKVIRDICRDQNKEAELVIRGGEVEIDKRVLEEMKDAILHILRNCIDHGVETTAERARLGKPACASIVIAVTPVNGNKVEILVTDDGGGIDVERVKEAAVRHGAISAADARQLSDADALSLTFNSDVSTSPVITSISGRGLGMAIVRTKAEKLGGRVSIESTRNVGTSIRMILPLTLSTFRGILVSVHDRVFVIPTINVDRVLRLKSADVRTVENRETITLEGKAVSLSRLDAVLQLPPRSETRDANGTLPVVVVHFADQRVAFAVDEVIHEEEVLVKALRKPLVRVRNIAGATVLGSGKAAPILNIGDLVQSAKNHSPAGSALSTTAVEIAKKKILVVEDSITSRMLLKAILESAGYHVQTAVDGVAAFTVAREARFDLIVSDVEMPRMNGFDLTAKIRAEKSLADLPVVLVTALESREQRERGIDAGANAYIIKSNFDQSNLLDAVKRLI